MKLCSVLRIQFRMIDLAMRDYNNSISVPYYEYFWGYLIVNCQLIISG